MSPEIRFVFDAPARRHPRSKPEPPGSDSAAVVCRVKPSVRRAYLDCSDIFGTLTAVYETLKETERALCRALVQTTADRLAEVVQQLEPDRPASLRGYRIKVFDCNHLAGTEHRIPETRAVKEAVLPGQTLVVYDLDLGLVIDAVPCEDAHAQERSLPREMLLGCGPRDLWIGDRNFCVAWMFLELSARGAYFLVRQHATGVHVEPMDEIVVVGRTATGEVQEQKSARGVDGWPWQASVRRARAANDAGGAARARALGHADAGQ